MKSLASFSLLLLAAAPAATAQEPPPGDGPRGSSERVAGEVRYDAVGYAAPADDLAGVSVASAELPVGSYAEVTALDTGRTIVVAVAGGGVSRGYVAMLSARAAAALGVQGDRVAVRVRKVTPTPQDVVQLRDGAAASFRAEAPPALLVALRKKLPPPVKAPPPPRKAIVAKAPTSRPTPVAKPIPPVAKAPATPVPKTAASGYAVQIAALSSAARAETVAKAVGGSIVAGPPVWRVRLGPYPDTAAATRAKVEAARKGYPGGQIIRIP